METQSLCPQLLVWRQIYTVLEEAFLQAGVDGMPPPPPAFNMQSWSLSTFAHKRQRGPQPVPGRSSTGSSSSLVNLQPMTSMMAIRAFNKIL